MENQGSPPGVTPVSSQPRPSPSSQTTDQKGRPQASPVVSRSLFQFISSHDLIDFLVERDNLCDQLYCNEPGADPQQCLNDGTNEPGFISSVINFITNTWSGIVGTETDSNIASGGNSGATNSIRRSSSEGNRLTPKDLVGVTPSTMKLLTGNESEPDAGKSRSSPTLQGPIFKTRVEPDSTHLNSSEAQDDQSVGQKPDNVIASKPRRRYDSFGTMYADDSPSMTSGIGNSRPGESDTNINRSQTSLPLRGKGKPLQPNLNLNRGFDHQPLSLDNSDVERVRSRNNLSNLAIDFSKVKVPPQVGGGAYKNNPSNLDVDVDDDLDRLLRPPQTLLSAGASDGTSSDEALRKSSFQILGKKPNQTTGSSQELNRADSPSKVFFNPLVEVEPIASGQATAGVRTGLGSGSGVGQNGGTGSSLNTNNPSKSGFPGKTAQPELVNLQKNQITQPIYSNPNGLGNVLPGPGRRNSKLDTFTPIRTDQTRVAVPFSNTQLNSIDPDAVQPGPGRRNFNLEGYPYTGTQTGTGQTGVAATFSNAQPNPYGLETVQQGQERFTSKEYQDSPQAGILPLGQDSTKDRGCSQVVDEVTISYSEEKIPMKLWAEQPAGMTRDKNQNVVFSYTLTEIPNGTEPRLELVVDGEKIPLENDPQVQKLVKAQVQETSKAEHDITAIADVFKGLKTKDTTRFGSNSNLYRRPLTTQGPSSITLSKTPRPTTAVTSKTNVNVTVESKIPQVSKPGVGRTTSVSRPNTRKSRPVSGADIYVGGNTAANKTNSKKKPQDIHSKPRWR